MPQDQDDIKGADAMKQAPTPGPLTASDVKLLVKGDLLRIDTGGALYEFVRRKAPPSALIVAKPALDGSERYYDRCRFSFVERPSLAPTAPVEASGSEREDPDFWCRLMGEALDALDTIASDEPWSDGATSAVFAEKASATIRAKYSDLSSEPHDERRGGYDRSDVRYGLQLIADEECDEVAAAYYAKKALAALRPQPSGEAREADDKLFHDSYIAMRDAMRLIDADEGPGRVHSNALQALADCRVRIENRTTALSARPAPVASGGQHSSATVFPPGEVTDEWAERFCEAVNWSPDGQECKAVEGQVRCVSFRDLAKGYILSAIATQPAITSVTAPVAETAGEAVAWQYRHPDDTDWQITQDHDQAFRNTGEVEPLGVIPFGVPAQDDDKLRIAELEAERDTWKTMAENGAQALPQYVSRATAAEARADRLADSNEGLTEDLYQAVLVAYRRGAHEWAWLNYPQWRNALAAGQEVAPIARAALQQETQP